MSRKMKWLSGVAEGGANKDEVRPPTTLASLKRDGCGPLVDLAHQLLRVKIALENAFPGPSVDVQDAFA
jgi:hypothetical protein